MNFTTVLTLRQVEPSARAQGECAACGKKLIEAEGSLLYDKG